MDVSGMLMKWRRRLLSAAAIVLLTALPVGAQEPADQQNRQILDELRQIRQLLERLVNQQPPAPRAAGVAVDEKVKLARVTGYALGNADAPLTMVEFTDLQCPFCRLFHVTTFEELKKDYIDTGKLRYISRDFPLSAMHPQAIGAARASRCAADQDKFWEMRHTILVNNEHLSNDVFVTFAQDLKLNVATFSTCMADATKLKTDTQQDVADATSAGVSGTPTFVIGRTSASGLDGIRLVGAQPYAVFDAKLKDLLAAKPPAP
jgi:protein-disulfide isomerase